MNEINDVASWKVILTVKKIIKVNKNGQYAYDEIVLFSNVNFTESEDFYNVRKVKLNDAERTFEVNQCNSYDGRTSFLKENIISLTLKRVVTYIPR